MDKEDEEEKNMPPLNPILGSAAAFEN